MVFEDFKNMKIDEALRKFEELLSTKTNKVIVLRKKADNTYLFLPYKTRFSKAYKRQIKRTLRQVLDNSTPMSIGHFTLTLQNLDFVQITQKKRDLMKTLNTFIKKLNRILKTQIKYVCTREITQTNSQEFHFHFHLICYDLRHLSTSILEDTKQAWFETCEKNGLHALYAHYDYIKQFRYALNYVMKYIQKEFTEVNLTSTILHLLNLRSYTTSENLTPQRTRIQQGEYDFMGIYDKTEAKNLFGYEEIETDGRPHGTSQTQNDPYPPSIQPEIIYIS